jgi:Uma2 family endonuclease
MVMPAATRRWTIEDLDRLPDDGNSYEVVRGQLFVTPAPGPRHEVVVTRLASILTPYVAARELGHVYHRAVVRFDDSEAEPDLSVREQARTIDTPWEAWPIPLLVVEVLSPTTRRRDFGEKRDFYVDAGVGDYWIVDADSRRIHVVRGKDDVTIVGDEMRWHPAAASDPLVFAIDQLFI